jgi:hypothetical protein
MLTSKLKLPKLPLNKLVPKVNLLQKHLLKPPPKLRPSKPN